MGVQREKRLIAEWAKERHQFDRVILGAYLGEPRQELVHQLGMPRAIKVSRPWRLQVDAIVITRDKLILAEAKVYQVKQAIGDLMLYSRIVDDTPELKEYINREHELVMVIPWITDYVTYLANTVGVKIDIFQPSWVIDYIEDHHKYWSKDYQRQREEKKRMRELLGVD